MMRVLLLPLLLAGCAATEEENYYRGYILPTNIERSVAGQELDSVNPTKQNALRTGDTFVFNNPSEVWTVTGVTDESVTWESPAGNFMRTSALTFLPPLEWGGDASVSDSGRRELSELTIGAGVEDFKPGSTYSFTETRHNDRPPTMNVTNWTCTLGEQEEIVVPAGKTSAVPIICSQNGLQRLLVNYSPNLGYIVRHVLSTAAGPVVRELTAYQRLSTKDDG